MNNYLLSIDPSIKNTGFTLWEKECEPNCKYLWKLIGTNTQHTNDIWKPIWITSYSFNKNNDFYLEIKSKVNDLIEITRKINRFNIIIERGTFHSNNGIGYETQEHLRGFIAGQFNKLLTKDMLISPSEWKKYIINNFLDSRKIKWTKEISISQANELIKLNNWNITISNHDEADSLLIGWYYLNKDNKNE